MTNPANCKISGITITVPTNKSFFYQGLPGSYITTTGTGSTDAFKIIPPINGVGTYIYVHDLSLIGPGTQDVNSFCSNTAGGNGFNAVYGGGVATRMNLYNINAERYCGSGKWAILLDSAENSLGFMLHGKQSDGGIKIINTTSSHWVLEAEENTTHGVFLQNFNGTLDSLVSQTNKLENLYENGVTASMHYGVYLENPNVSNTAATCNAVIDSTDSSLPTLSNTWIASVMHNITNNSSTSNIGFCLKRSGTGINLDNKWEQGSFSGAAAAFDLTAAPQQVLVNIASLASVTGEDSSTYIQETNSFKSYSPNGNAAIPSYSFTAHAGTGVYSSGAGDLGFSTAGVTGAYLDVSSSFHTLGGIVNTGTIVSSGDITLPNLNVLGTNVNYSTSWLTYVPATNWVVRDVVNGLARFTVVKGTAGTLAAQVDGIFNATTGYQINGVSGYTGAKTAGSCSLTVVGGIITNITGC